MCSTFLLSSSTFFFHVPAPALRFMLSVQGSERVWITREAESHLLSSSCHLCICLCLSQIWRADTKALFHPCSSSRGWHFIQADTPAVSDTFLLTNRRSQYVHISFWGRDTVEREGIRIVIQKKARNILTFCTFSTTLSFLCWTWSSLVVL